MYMFENSGVMIESLTELPLEFIGAEDVYIDFETSSGDAKEMSVNPHHHCSIAGVAFSIGADPYVYYIHYANFEPAQQAYICDYFHNLVTKAKRWINHNVKYDAHVCSNEMKFAPTCQLVDTLTLAKLIDSDRMTHGGYSLDALALAWCKLDMSKYEERLQPYLGRDNKDYGRIPADILGEYACEDIFAGKALFEYIWQNIPEQCWPVRDTEIELTRNLFEMEQNGMCIDLTEIQIKQYKILNRMITIDVELSELVGWHCNPKSSDDCYHLFCNQYGLPVLKYTIDQNTGEPTANPSFDKHVLKMYATHPLAPKHIVALVQEYRNLMQLNSLFLEPWQQQAIVRHGESLAILCATYNQCVRTGRMSCSDPNMQQNSSEAKKLIHPPKGRKFISIDYSQIELRTIVHYIDDKRSIQMWNENPDTDFHQFTADDIGVTRDPAKTLNFGMGFGEGKKKLTKQLATDESLVGGFVKQVDDMILQGKVCPENRAKVFTILAEKKAEDVYNGYHRRYPTMKSTAKQVEYALLRRGFVFNLAGRRRHLDRRFAYRAFNTVNQSSAADIMKNRVNAVCQMLKGTPIKLVAIVHDEVLFTCPNEYADMFETHRDLVHVLESNPFEMSVPIRCSIGTSEENWSKAGKSIAKGGNCAPLMYDRSVFTNLDHTRAHVR